MKFHDGAELTADVVKQNLQRSVALGSKASGTMIESVKMIDAVEVDADLRGQARAEGTQRPDTVSPGRHRRHDRQLRVARRRCVRGNFKAVGAGPYRLKSFESNVKTVMTRNDDYWGGTRAGRLGSSTITCRMGGPA